MIELVLRVRLQVDDLLFQIFIVLPIVCTMLEFLQLLYSQSEPRSVQPLLCQPERLHFTVIRVLFRCQGKRASCLFELVRTSPIFDLAENITTL